MIDRDSTQLGLVLGIMIVICLGLSACSPGTVVAQAIPIIPSNPIQASAPTLTAIPVSTATPAPPPEPTLAVLPDRVTTDRPDDVSGYQIHVIYVLPSDGVDRNLDTNGNLDLTVASFEKWFSSNSGGKQFRFDTYQGALDVSFFRLSRTGAAIASHHQYVRDEIQKDLHAAGFNKSNKLYAVYYDGPSDFSCGGGAWPPTLVGNVSAVYLQGAFGSTHCANNSFTSSIDSPHYWEFAMLHSIFNTLGAVAKCAPHFTQAGNVSDSNTDLMYAGNQPWMPSQIDVGHDDYFDLTNSTCLDIARSVFIDPLPVNAMKPPSW